MQWEIINTPKQPKCIFCDKTTSQMLVCHRYISLDNIHICSYCARFVKDAMNKWEGLKNIDYIEQSGIFNDKLIDKHNVGDIFNPDVIDTMKKYHKPTDKCNCPVCRPTDDDYDWRDNYHKGQKP